MTRQKSNEHKIPEAPEGYRRAMKTNILLCSDLDRTLLPDGPQTESPQARTKSAAPGRRTT